MSTAALILCFFASSNPGPKSFSHKAPNFFAAEAAIRTTIGLWPCAAPQEGPSFDRGFSGCMCQRRWSYRCWWAYCASSGLAEWLSLQPWSSSRGCDKCDATPDWKRASLWFWLWTRPSKTQSLKEASKLASLDFRQQPWRAARPLWHVAQSRPTPGLTCLHPPALLQLATLEQMDRKVDQLHVWAKSWIAKLSYSWVTAH